MTTMFPSDAQAQDAIKTLPRQLQEKIQHSIALLQKAEKIALKYDPQDGFFLAFSGGKDSQCLYHVAQLAGVRFKAHMSLTSVDPPDIIRFVRKHYPDCEMRKPDKSIYQRAVERKILPTMRIRWCCADFKETAGAGKVTLIGIRAAESSRRAKRHEVEVRSHKFSGDLDEFNEWSAQQIDKKKRKAEKRKINEDEFSVSSDNEVRCISGKDSILISPIFQWTEDDVWLFLNTLGIPHCNLYDEGFRRIGCTLCPMSSPKHKQLEIARWPQVKRNWIKAIKAIRAGGGYSKENLYGGTSRQQTSAPPRGQGVAMEVQRPSQRTNTGLWAFSPSSPSDGTDEERENEIAEAIFDWWISGKAYKKWYTDKYLQLKLDFDDTASTDIQR